MAAHEEIHWWFVGRRAVIRRLLQTVPLRPDARILEAGCGTGGNLYLLREHGDVVGFDPNDLALELARAKQGDFHVVPGSLPARPETLGSDFDLVVALDVLEHVEDHVGAMATILELVRPGGSALITVPAVKRLWGSHDLRLGHVRRYDRRDLEALVDLRCNEIEFIGHFNFLLLPLASTFRVLERILGRDLGNQERMPAGPVNWMLGRIFSLERYFVTRGIPIGLSLAMVVRRRELAEEPGD
jgi:SAM-dependent methyltransferase